MLAYAIYYRCAKLRCLKFFDVMDQTFRQYFFVSLRISLINEVLNLQIILGIQDHKKCTISQHLLTKTTTVTKFLASRNFRNNNRAKFRETSLLVHVFISTDVRPRRPRSCWTIQCKLFLYGLIKKLFSLQGKLTQYFQATWQL